MVETFSNFNEAVDRTQTYKGIVEFIDPNTSPPNEAHFRLKERQSLQVTYRFLRETHYNDEGIKNIDWAGYDHTFSLTIKMTSDMFDNVSSFTGTGGSSDGTTLTFWLEQNMPPNNIALEIKFISSSEALSGPTGSETEKFLDQIFQLVPHTFGPVTLNRGTGTQEITVIGEVISITKIIRSATTQTWT